MPQKSNLALVGYGKMGRLIEQLAHEYDFTVTERLDEYNNVDGAGIATLRNVDVAIEFSTPETAPAAILDEARRSVRRITAQREQTARRIATKLGLAVPAAGGE